ncbi:hypothetical protein [Chroococcidiopsis sp. CCMEE 29]|uniref:hypothetical protein n=1 Tax=Chroococcidiopsis sp. CCMEE 29 TaxID=155894 RepID=UPI00201FC09C|nr:hypothetical protein [Chroococcidiopsis sp. CCMEE 29]
MNLDEQIQVLIDNAPQDGVMPRVVAAIAPALQLLAKKFRHFQYYILQNLDQDWVLTTLSNRANPDVEKRVIYAFPTLKDVSAVSAAKLDPQVIAVPIPITHILFQLAALETVDSIVFFETPGDLNTGVEVRREDLQHVIQVQLKQNPFPNQIPHDIA